MVFAVRILSIHENVNNIDHFDSQYLDVSQRRVVCTKCKILLKNI